MFTWNLIFMFLHLVETHLLFDGLAQDVPIWTSQGSVILMLVFVLIIENRRRGLFLGKRVEKPFTADRLIVTLENALKRQDLEEIVDLYRRDHFHEFVGASLPMQSVYQIISSAAASKAPSSPAGHGRLVVIVTCLFLVRNSTIHHPPKSVSVLDHHNGMLLCFLRGSEARLPRSALRAAIKWGRVSRGAMTASR